MSLPLQPKLPRDRRLLAHLRANAVAYVALFFALSGGALAATQVPNHSVGTAQLKKNSVGSEQLKANAVASGKVKDGSLQAKDFAAGQLPAGPEGKPGPEGPPGPEGQAGESFEGEVPEDGSHHGVKTLLGALGVTVTCASAKVSIELGNNSSSDEVEVVGFVSNEGEAETVASRFVGPGQGFGLGHLSVPYLVADLIVRNLSTHAAAHVSFSASASGTACRYSGFLIRAG